MPKPAVAPPVVAIHEAGLQVRDLIELDRELVLTCLGCERTKILDQKAILHRFRDTPGATLAAIQLKSRCPGCGGRAKISTADGPSTGNELLPGRHDYLDRRAKFVRRVLAQAGIDPASWGYPPLDHKRPSAKLA